MILKLVLVLIGLVVKITGIDGEWEIYFSIGLRSKKLSIQSWDQGQKVKCFQGKIDNPWRSWKFVL